MVTQYQAEFEKAIQETFEYLCKEYKNPVMQAGFEIFAVHMRGAAMRIKPHTPVSRNYSKGHITGGYKVKK